MSGGVRILLTFAVAIIGSWVGLKSKVPAGALVGAIFSVGIFQLLFELAWFPSQLRVISTSITGAYLGGRITRSDLHSLRQIPVAAVLMMVVMFSYNIFCAVILDRYTATDFITGLLATAPGGLTEMSLVAMDFHANSSIISSIQLLRFVVVATCTPIVMRFFLTRRHTYGAGSEAADSPQKQDTRARNIKEMTIPLVIGLLSGTAGKLSGLPAGTLCFSVIACACYNLATNRGGLPKQVRYTAQCSNGALIGSRILAGELLMLGSILPVVVVITAGWLVLNILLGWLLYRVGKLSLETAMFSAAPGGMSDMGLISAEMGGNAAQVTALQLCRVVSVIVFCPSIAVLLG